MSPDDAPLLAVDGLVKRFGGFHALDGLTFTLHGGEILGLVGPNGSGKTTAINVISGLYAPDQGEVRLEGRAVGGLAPHRLVHAGINRTFQIPKPFQSLTVRENVAIAVVVEHLMGFLDQITDRVIVMNAGKEIFEGVLADAAKDPGVVEVFLGADDAA
jgi:branched-chain amino acid transport system ATP-binding protein